MHHLYDPINVYGTAARKVMRLLLPYEKHMIVMVKQDDSLCLYTPETEEVPPTLFAAVQIVTAGIALTVYNPGPSHKIFEHLPRRIKMAYTGDNKFLLTKATPGIITEINDLLSALFGIYSLGKYYQLQES